MSLEQAILDARKALNRDLLPARLGDNGQGNPYDLDTPGNLWVQKIEANGGLSENVSLPVYPNANIPVKSGVSVELGYDERGTLCVYRANAAGLSSANINPLILNPLDQSVYGKVKGANIANFFCQRHGDLTNYPLTVVVFPGAIERNDTMQIFSGATVDLSALVPGDDLHCYAVVFIKTDLTLEAFASTPVALTQPLTDVDISEAIAQRTADSLTIWAWELSDSQTVLSPDPTKNVDLRQWLNVASGGGGGVTSVTADPPLASSGGTTPNITFGNIPEKIIFDEWTESGTPAANTLWQYAADDSGFTFPRTIDSAGNISQIYRDVIIVCKNVTGSTIAAHSAVYITSADGGVPTITKAIATSVQRLLANGFTMESVADGAFVRVMTFGILDFDTSGFSAGAELYLSKTTAGAIQSSQPSTAWGQYVGKALDSAVGGHILVLFKGVDLAAFYLTALNIGNGTSAAIDFLANSQILQLEPATLTNNRTVQFPDNSGVIILNAGIQTFQNGIIVNELGLDNDTRIESNNDANNFFSDGGNDNIGIGTGTPNAAAKLEVVSTSKGSIPAPVMTAAQVAAISSPTEGLKAYASDTDEDMFYDGQRWRPLESVGWTPFAYPASFNPQGVFTTAIALTAQYASLAVPMVVQTHMLLESVSVRNTNTANPRTWGWNLYKQYLNNGNSGENTLTQVAASSANETFTPGAASTRTITAASAPVYLAPGVYWLVIQNRHATNAFSVGSDAASTQFALNTGQTKDTGSSNGTTLDFVAATWTKVTSVIAVRLNGRVFGETTAY